MTIVRKFSDLRKTPFRVFKPRDIIYLDSVFREHNLHNATKAISLAVIASLIDLILDITDRNVNYNHKVLITDRHIKAIIGGLQTEEICKLSSHSKRNYSLAFVLLLKNKSGTKKGRSIHSEFINQCKNTWKGLKINNKKANFWYGRVVTGTNSNKEWLLRLWDIEDIFGKKFADSIHLKVSEFTNIYRIKTSEKIVVELNEFFYYLATKDISSTTFFNNSHNNYSLMRNYFTYSAESKIRRGVSVEYIKKNWNTWLRCFDDIFFKSNLWCSPTPPLSSMYINSKKTTANIKTDSYGNKYVNKLLTKVPIEITDEEAIESLLLRIRLEKSIVIQWAEHESNKLFSSYLKRLKLAKRGHVNTTPDWNQKLSLADLAATFESRGFEPTSNNMHKLYGSNALSRMKKKFGIPYVGTLIPYMILLINEHPFLTESSLMDIELFDIHGNKKSIYQTNTGEKIVLTKHRAKREQSVILSDKATRLINEIEMITNCLRKYMKIINDDDWRYLFLSSSSGFRKPVRIKTFDAYKSQLKTQFYESMKGISEIEDNELSDIAKRITLTRFRAQCGVEVFLNTMSVEEMAKALGHKHHDPNLLNSYLPSTIQLFFYKRWIKIFQKGLLAEAMKDSEFMMEALKFESAEKMAKFLLNHSLDKQISTFYTNHENTDVRNKDEILVSVSIEILTELLSLKHALKVVKCQVTETLKFWGEITNCLINEIENKLHYQSFANALAIANTKIDTAKYVSFITKQSM